MFNLSKRNRKEGKGRREWESEKEGRWESGTEGRRESGIERVERGRENAAEAWMNHFCLLSCPLHLHPTSCFKSSFVFSFTLRNVLFFI